jgi:hypothetical protein
VQVVVKGALKLEILGSRVFTQVIPVWVGALGARAKIRKVYCFGSEIAILYFSALSPTAQIIFKCCRPTKTSFKQIENKKIQDIFLGLFN